jgi:hypothetical protein
LERYLKTRPDDLRALQLAFHTALRLDRPADAQQFLSRAEAVSPDDPRVVKMRAKAAGLSAGPPEDPTIEDN